MIITIFYFLNLSDGVKNMGLSEGGGVGVDLEGVTIGPKWLKLLTLPWLILLLLQLVEVLGVLLQFPFSPDAAAPLFAFSSRALPLSSLASRLAKSSPMSSLGNLLFSTEPPWPRIPRPHPDSTGSLWLTIDGEEVTTWCVSQIRGYTKGDDSSFFVSSLDDAFDLKFMERLKHYHCIISWCVWCTQANNTDSNTILQPPFLAAMFIYKLVSCNYKYLFNLFNLVSDPTIKTLINSFKDLR